MASLTWIFPPRASTCSAVAGVHFPLPTWQQAAYVPPAPNNRPGRGVPDVAGDAAPSTGYQITVDGAFGVVGGTSAVAPLWAGLVALLNQIVGQPVGFLNPLLYSKLPQGILNDITQGNNGQYSAGPGWDPVTGLGSPNGANIVSALQPPSKVTPQRGAKRRRPAPKRRTTKVKPKRGKKTKRSKKKR